MIIICCECGEEKEATIEQVSQAVQDHESLYKEKMTPEDGLICPDCVSKQMQ